jgi:tetratricopeptide (TPR) repeat protein
MSQPSKSILSRCFLLLLVFPFSHGLFAQSKVDSLENVFANGTNDSVKLTALIQLGKMNLLSNSAKAEGYARQCISLARQKGLDANEASGWNLLGNVFFYRDKFPEAIEKYQKALAIYVILQNNKVVASQYRNIGLCYTRMGDYKTAVDYNFRSMEIAESFKDTVTIASLSNDIGNIFYYQKDFLNAEKYYQKTIGLFKSRNNPEGVARALNNLGSVNSELKNYKEALNYYTQAFEIRQRIRDTSGIITCLTNIGQLHGLNGDFQSSLKAGYEALKLAEYSHDDFAKASCLSHLANAYNEMKDYPKAISYGTQSLEISENRHDPEHQKDMHLILSEIYQGAHNTDKALYHYKKYISYRDSLINEENTKKSIQTLMLYEFNKKQAADSIRNTELVKVEELKHQQEIRQQKMFTYGGIIGFAFMLIVAGLSFRAYRQKQKANMLVNEQKELVEEKQKEILASIHYAKRIQESILPTDKYINKNLDRLNKN